VEIAGRRVDCGTIEKIRGIVAAAPGLSRSALSRRICEQLNWRALNGRLQQMSCRKALVRLHAKGLIKLESREKEYSFQRSTFSNVDISQVPKLECSLAELGGVEVIPVSSRYAKASQVWNALLDKYHYLGSGPLCGAQIRYLVRTQAGDLLGGLSFGSATWRLKRRDELIGWSEKARHANLSRVVCNGRFLIVPTVRVPNLASHVLSLCISRLCDDWQQRYGTTPVLVETFVDPSRFTGTCYQAANWICIGQTAGRSTPYPNGKAPNGKKDIYVYPLTQGFEWQKVLCTEPKAVLRSKKEPAKFDDWAQEEFGAIEVYDERLKERACTLARDFFAQPGALVPQACNGSVAKMKAAYRFFGNKQISMDVLLKPHIEATVQRVKAHKTVLAVQDTTTLDYTAHIEAEGLGPICHKNDSCIGLVLHDTMAFSVEGVALGLLNLQCWARDPEQAGKKHKRKQLPIELKESNKWLKSYRAVAEAQQLCPETMLVSVGDREADIYELFAEVKATEHGPQLLVRADKARQRQVEQELLWEKMARLPVSGYREVHVPRSGNRRARTAKLEIRYSQVVLQPPTSKKLPPISIWAVYAVETDCAPEVKEPIEWMLLTTVPVTSLEQAEERMSWYAKRWGIEVYHRVLKSGCRIEDRRLDNADRLEACIAIDAVVGWRILLLTMQGRETPEMSCDAILSQEEWKALCAFFTQKPPPAKPPSLKEAVWMIAKLGGFLGRRGDGHPGTITVWRGLQRLEDISITYAVAESIFLQRQRDGP
jgi:hypothetical protein